MIVIASNRVSFWDGRFHSYHRHEIIAALDTYDVEPCFRGFSSEDLALDPTTQFCADQPVAYPSPSRGLERSGIVNRKVVPSPARDSTQIRPAYLLTIRSHIDKPNPVPGILPSRRLNG